LKTSLFPLSFRRGGQGVRSRWAAPAVAETYQSTLTPT
jgi:hypothetical protein